MENDINEITYGDEIQESLNEIKSTHHRIGGGPTGYTLKKKKQSVSLALKSF